MTRKISLLLALATLALVGCQSHTYTAPHTTAQAEPAYSSWHHHLLWGLVDASGEVDLDRVCPGGVARIENEETFLNGLVRAFTGFLYTPTTVRVYCSATSSITDLVIHPTLEMVERWRQLYPDVEQHLEAMVASHRRVRALAAAPPASL